MHLFGICFVLYILNVSAGKGFWFHLRTTDREVFKLYCALKDFSPIQSNPFFFTCQELKKQSALGNTSNPELPTSYWQQSELHEYVLTLIIFFIKID